MRYPYGYEDGKYDDPATHNFGPNGPTAWLLRNRQTYHFAYDNGAVLQAGIPIGDASKRSADAVTVPMFRVGKDGSDRLFGMISMHSYQPELYDNNAVRAFEWLTGTVARVVTREAEDREALRLLPAGEETPNLLTSDYVMEYLCNWSSDQARPDGGTDPSELIEMMLDADEGPSNASPP